MVQSIHFIILFQCDKWSQNPDLFVEDEDEDSFSYSVRISAQDLLMVRNIAGLKL